MLAAHLTEFEPSIKFVQNGWMRGRTENCCIWSIEACAMSHCCIEVTWVMQTKSDSAGKEQEEETIKNLTADASSEVSLP